MALKSVTSVGILGASPGLAGTIETFASGEVGPRMRIAAPVGLDQVGDILAGGRPVGAGFVPSARRSASLM